MLTGQTLRRKKGKKKKKGDGGDPTPTWSSNLFIPIFKGVRTQKEMEGKKKRKKGGEGGGDAGDGGNLY